MLAIHRYVIPTDIRLFYSDSLQFGYKTIIAEHFHYLRLAILPISTISFDSNNINGAIQQQAAVANSGSSSRLSNSSNNRYSEKRDRSRTYSRSIEN